MTAKKTVILYSAVFFLSLGLFGYTLFPKDKIKQHIIVLFETAYPGMALDMQDISLALPAGIKLVEPRIDVDKKNNFTAQKLTVGYRLLSLFGGNHDYALNAKAYEGSIDGKVEISKTNSQELSADIALAGIQAGQIGFISDMSKKQFAGILNGDISYKRNGKKQQGSLSLQMTECKVPLMVSFMNFGVLDFNDIQMQAKLTNQNLNITSCILKGVQVDGDVSGTINLSDAVEQSRLNLSANLKPHPDFIKSLPQNLMPANFIGPNGINFKIMGTFESPNFVLR